MLRCIAIDDEPLALTQIASYIGKVPYLELVGKCRDANEALKVLQQTQVDLMFVDINMPDLNGLDFVLRQRIRGAQSRNGPLPRRAGPLEGDADRPS